MHLSQYKDMIKEEVKKMNCSKVGKLILTLRQEKGMTQKALADEMNISDRTISKWERGVSQTKGY